MKQSKIKYKYVSYIEYKPLEDGTPNYHHNSYMQIKGESTPLELLNNLAANSKLGYIQDLEIEEVEYEEI